MRRYIALYLPLFPVQHAMRVQGIEPDAAFALTQTIANQSRIILCSKTAQKAGVRTDMTSALGKALCPALQTYRYEPLQDFKMIYKIGITLLKLSPFVALDSTLIRAYKTNRLAETEEQYFGLVLDITGTERLYVSEQNLLKKIFILFEKMELSVVAGVSSTIGSAWALSRFGNLIASEVKFIQQRKQKAFIAAPSKNAPEQVLQNLPLRSLRVSVDVSSKLSELGLYTIKSLNDYNAKELALRFGTALTSRLDQACGRAEETLFLLHPKEHIVTDYEFDPPLRVKKAVEHALIKNILETIQKLAKLNKRAAQFVLTIQGINPYKPVLEAAFCIRKTFALHSGSNNISHISSIITPFFEQLAVPEGVTRITLAAKAVQSSEQEQEHCFYKNKTYAPEVVRSELLNLLSAQLGKSNVRVIELHESFTPEKSYSFVPLEHARKQRSSQHALTRYPTSILTRPEKIAAISLLPDAPPTRITWKGKRYKIQKGFGPERISAEWWQQPLRDTPEEREYFRVQDERGRWLWLYRTRKDLQWFLHGMWL